MLSRAILIIPAAISAFAAANAATISPKLPAISDNCYQISDADELYGFAAIVNGTDGFVQDRGACGILSKDIVVNTDVLDDSHNLNKTDGIEFEQWNPIDSFSGTFDGNGHTISGLYYEDKDEYKYVGIFSTVIATPDKPVIIKNLGILDSYIEESSSYSGVLIGSIADFDGDYKDSYAQISNTFVLSTTNYTPAMIGKLDNRVHLTIENCYNGYGKKIVYTASGYVETRNSFALNKNESTGDYQVSLVTINQFRSGAVAAALREGTNGSIWGQNVGTDEYPNFSGSLQNTVAAKYSVTFHTFEGDTAKYFDSYISGFTTELPRTVEKENTKFYGWYRDKEFSGDPEKVIDTSTFGDLEYWARIRNTYSVTLHTNGGSINWNRFEYEYFDDSVGIYVEGDGMTLPGVTSRDGRLFLHWYDNEELTGEPVYSISTTDKGNKDFYAKWLQTEKPNLDESDSCYEISSAAELYGFVGMVNGTYGYGEKQADICGKLTKDVVINKNLLKRDGTLDDSNKSSLIPWKSMNRFKGTFDGQGHKISGLYNSVFIDYIDTTGGAKKTAIRNLTIDDSYVTGSSLVTDIDLGASLSIDNCHFKGYVSAFSATFAAGGFVSLSQGLVNIQNSSVEGIIASGYSAPLAIGGFIGESFEHLMLTNSFVKATFIRNTKPSPEDDAAAGREVFVTLGSFVGHLTGHAIIVNNYSVTNMTGATTGSVGGLIGRHYATAFSSSTSRIVKQYNALESYIANNYNMSSYNDEFSLDECNAKWTCENNFYLEGEITKTDCATPMAADKFTDNTVASALHDYTQKDSEGNAIDGGFNGNIWTQGEDYPVFATNTTGSKHVVMLEPNGGTLANFYINYTTGETITLPEPTLEHYTFKGWYTTEDFRGERVYEITETDSEDMVLYAKWIIKQYKITFVINGEGTVYCGKMSGQDEIHPNYPYAFLDYHTDVYIVAISNQGHHVESISGHKNCHSNSCNFYLQEDLTITVNFAEDVYSSSEVVSSSSEVVSSSSSETELSSSSDEKSSSSSAETSSSSSAKSSSSSVSSSSSKDDKDAITVPSQIPQFSLTAVGRNIQVAGAHLGSAYIVFDMQGRILTQGAVHTANFNIVMNRYGPYIVRIGNQVQKIILK